MSQNSMIRARAWLGGLGVIVTLAILTVAAGAVSNLLVHQETPRGTPWYGEAAASEAQAIPARQDETAAQSTDSKGAAKALSKAFHEAAGRVLPAVVAISVVPRMEQDAAADQEEGSPLGFRGSPLGEMFRMHPELRQFFREMPSPMMPGRRVAGAGSGVIVDASGVILTNNHVVAGGGKVTVRLQDGREFDAGDIKTDPKTDVAVLRIKGASDLPVAKLGDSGAMDVGDWVLALGQPFGLQGTVTAGIISAKGRGIGITEREDFLQTDAAINPGNSGGPLVNLEGEVIGINTAISSNSGGYQGVGFAIPINLAKWVGGQLATAGKVRRAYLGVLIQPVTAALAEQFKVKVREGVLVTDVQPESPAAKAGLKAGDIILRFAGKPVSRPQELQGHVETVATGSQQPLAILRNGKPMTLQVTCAEMPADFDLARMGSRAVENAETGVFDKLGLEVENLTAALAEQLGAAMESGVVVTNVRPGSPADKAGLAAGLVITQANRQAVKNVADLRTALASRSLQQGVLLLVRSSAGSRFVVIRSTAG